jgi:23S rRNA pseudouridine1911/1915/1917 synthase
MNDLSYTMNIQVLYEDNHLIAVYKPAGILVQGDESGEKSLMDFTKEFLKEKYQKPGNVFLGLLHRLDRNVSGIVLFAKTSKGASRLSEQFRERTVDKIYHAWVEGVVRPKKGKLVHYLYRDEKGNKAKVFDEQRKNTQESVLSYEVVEDRDGGEQKGKDEKNAMTLLKITLETGRHHQIRAQLGHIGHPIVGDVKYGSTTKFSNQSIKLCATELSFDTATEPHRETIRIEIPALV